MLSEIRSLPLKRVADFESDSRNIWTAESCLRRALEALFDVGRHILAKGFGKGVAEYKEIASALAKSGVLTSPQAALFRILAGYRNRLVHFYHEVSPEELYEICSARMDDLAAARDALRAWFDSHPDLVDDAL